MTIPSPFRSAWRNSGLRVISLRSYTHAEPTHLHTVRPAHQHWGLHVFVCGNSHAHLPSGMVALGPGDALISRPEEGYTQDIAASDPPAQWIVADFELLALPGHEDPLRRLQPPILIRGLDPQHLQAWIAAIPAINHPERGMHLRPMLDAILSQCICHGFTQGHLHLDSGALPRWLVDIRQILGEAKTLRNPKLNLETIIGMAGVSRSQLCQAFQRHIGCSPMQWVRRERITNACRLLRHGNDRSIASIAQSCGYRSTPLFCRHFLAMMGCSASAWRKAATGDQRSPDNNETA